MTNSQYFDGIPCKSIGTVSNIPTESGGNIILVNVAMVTTHVDFNLPLGHDYMHAMEVMVSFLFHVMFFLYKGCNLTIDQLSYSSIQPYLT
jgi:hypothetical protein